MHGTPKAVGWWAWLTRPARDVRDPVDRRSARLIASLSLALAPAALLTAIGMQASGDPRFTAGTAAWIYGGTIAMCLQYVVSRTRHFRIAGLGLAGITTFVATGVALVNPVDPGWFAFALLSPLLAGSLLPLRQATVVVAANAALIAGVAWLNPGIPAVLAVIATMFNLLGGALILITADYRNEVEEIRRDREQTRRREHREVLDLAFDGLAVLEDGRIAETNRGFAEIFARGESELLGADFLELFSAEDRPRVTAALEGRTAGAIEVHGVAGEDQPRVLELITNARKGRVRASEVVAVRDITAQRAAEHDLQHAQRLDAVGRLAGGVAHDFNNLLTVIVGETDLLELDLGPEHRGALASVRSATAKAAQLTRQLLAFSRRQVLEPRTVDLHTVVSEMERLLVRLLGEDVALRVRSEPELYVRIDPTQLEQVIVNLAINARHAMPNGGTLSLTAESSPDEDTVILGVRDTGEGIPADRIQHIFEPFFTTRARAEGTGLGLAVVHGIIRQSGGAISVTSEPNRGTTFTIHLPRVEAPADTTAERATPSPRATTHATILLVEDEPGVAAVIERMLENDHRVLVAHSGLEASALLDGHAGPIDVAVIDVVLQDQNGAEVARNVRERHPEAAILHISGYPEGRMDARGELVDDTMLLQKPFTAPQLRAAIDAALRARPRRQARGA